MTRSTSLVIEPGMHPLTVTAHLAAGIAFDSEWPTTLDGLLAAELWHQQKATQTEPFAGLSNTEDPEDLPLPLARCIVNHGPRTGDWHWAATAGHIQAPPGEDEIPIDVHYTLSELNQRHAGMAAKSIPKQLPAHRGRWRQRRLPLVTYLTAKITWQAVGDPNKIITVLEPVTAIGKKRSHGHGQITQWNIDISDRTADEAAHLHPNGMIGRPQFPECGHQTDRVGASAIRPPYIHRSRLRDNLALPGPVR